VDYSATDTGNNDYEQRNQRKWTLVIRRKLQPAHRDFRREHGRRLLLDTSFWCLRRCTWPTVKPRSCHLGDKAQL
jgi:hypothetical protein